jgi:hypothetical protein
MGAGQRLDGHGPAITFRYVQVVIVGARRVSVSTWNKNLEAVELSTSDLFDSMWAFPTAGRLASGAWRIQGHCVEIYCGH